MMRAAAAGFGWSSASDAETATTSCGASGGRRGGGSSTSSTSAQQRDAADQRAKAMLREAVDAVVESFARGPPGLQPRWANAITPPPPLTHSP
ncbi:hypothetical protein MRX96_055507 [Rhipicephalus microplus]